MVYRIGIDENGLGAQLGPLVVTAVAARVDERGARMLGRKLPERIRADLDDSKALVSCHDITLGEAWARALSTRQGGPPPRRPSELFTLLSREPIQSLDAACPTASKPQCWAADEEEFSSTDDDVARLVTHLEKFAERGVVFDRAQSQLVCTARLNSAKLAGQNRFVVDLHAMERLFLDAQLRAGEPILAVAGKVGGMTRYEPFFGPLSGYLKTALGEAAAESAYHFPGLGELRFVRDADAVDPLVMLASLVGKYVRELFMGRIGRFYPKARGDSPPSGYHDPITARFVAASARTRKKLGVTDDCFVRARDPAG